MFFHSTYQARCGTRVQDTGRATLKGGFKKSGRIVLNRTRNWFFATRGVRRIGYSDRGDL